MKGSHLAVAAATLLLLLTGCSTDGEGAAESDSGADTAPSIAPCLITEGELRAITGAPREYDDEGDDPDNIRCSTMAADDELTIEWSLGKATGLATSMQENKPILADREDISRIELDEGVEGWLDTSDSLGNPSAVLVAALGQRDLTVEIRGAMGTDSDLPAMAREIAQLFTQRHFAANPTSKPQTAPSNDAGICLLEDEALAEAMGVSYAVDDDPIVHPNQVACSASWSGRSHVTWGWRQDLREATPVVEDMVEVPDDLKEPLDLGDGHEGWLVPTTALSASAYAVVDDTVLLVQVGRASGDSPSLTKEELTEQAEALLRLWHATWLEAV